MLMGKNMKFNKRMLFPTNYINWLIGGSFNVVLFFIDMILWAIPAALIMTYFFVKYIWR